MKNISRKIFLGSLSSLAVIASSVALAEEMVTVPTFEGGVTASIGTFYAVPSVDDTAYLTTTNTDGDIVYVDVFNAETDYDFGWEGSLGYIFEGTANAIELYYRGFDGQNSTDPKDGTANGMVLENVQDSIRYKLNAFDLMISQFLDIGTHMQMRFSGGLSYAEIQQKQTVDGDITKPLSETEYSSVAKKSKFTGFGPRVAVDSRYDFGGEAAGFGIVGGASLAFYLGDTDLTTEIVNTSAENGTTDYTNQKNNANVTNLRANLGLDYVYFFDNEERSTLGLELGYMVDYYDDAVTDYAAVSSNAFGTPTTSVDNVSSNPTTNNALAFSGPYVQIKGVF